MATPANLGIDVGTDVKLAADTITHGGETAYRQMAIAVYETVGDGRKTVTTAGTREQLGSLTSCRKVTVQAELDNSGVVVVGGSSCVAALSTRRGLALEAGDSEDFYVLELADLYLDVTVSGDGVTYVYYE